MSRHLSIEELSGHLDGEARNGEAVQRHLESCQACSEKQRELAAAIRYLHGMPEPEINPNFAANVMREIESRDVRPAPLLIRLTTPALAAAMILLAAATTFGVYEGNSAQAPTATIASVTNFDNEQMLMQELERLVAENPESGTLLSADIVVEGEPLTPSVDDMLLAFYDPQLLENTAWIPAEDVDTAIAGLDGYETETLKELLREYAKEAGTI